MKGIRFTKAEVSALREVDELLRSMPCDTPKGWGGVMRKLAAAEEPTPSGVAIAPIQEALVAASRGKVVPLVGGSGYARATKQATAVGATVDDAKLIGAWMARTGWLTGPKTILDVLNQWSNWLTKATATAPPPSAPQGFGASGAVGGGAAEKDGKPQGGAVDSGQGATGGRRAPGFR